MDTILPIKSHAYQSELRLNRYGLQLKRQSRIVLLVGCLGCLIAAGWVASSYLRSHWGKNSADSNVTAESTPQERNLGDDAVTYPNTAVAFILGPQLKLGSKLNPYPWFDSNEVASGKKHARNFPKVPPMVLTGQVTVTGADKIVSGSGTRFRSEVNPSDPAPFFNGRLRILAADGKTYRDVQVQSVESDTQLTLSAPWQYESQSGAKADTYYSDGSNWNNDVYINANYYDLSLCLYVLYYRTGDETYLLEARKVADSWWLSPPINGGKSRDFEQNPYSPRNASLGGLMLRALDGRPEMWDWLNAYTRYMFNIWVQMRIKDAQPYLGVRDGGFMLLYATWLAKVLPNSFPMLDGGTATNGAALRAQYLSEAETAATQYYGRIQLPDGSWRWDDPYSTDADGGTLKGVMQPFMIGLLLHALIDVHRLTSNPAVKTSIQKQITKACKHLYMDGPYRSGEVNGLPGKRWRSFWYFYHGGTTVHPGKYERGGGSQVTTNQTWEVKSERQLIATTMSAYGYAYLITGDTTFKSMGDELFGSAFGDQIDGIHNEADGTPKNYNQNYRTGGRYLVWRLGANSAALSAPPSSSPTQVPKNRGSSFDLITSALSDGVRLIESGSSEARSVAQLLSEVDAARVAVEKLNNSAVSKELSLATEHLRIAVTAAKAGDAETVKARLQWATARLERARKAASSAQN